MVPLPISMHTGQIIMLAKMLAEVDLEFYDFSTGTTPVLTWKKEAQGRVIVCHSDCSLCYIFTV